MSTPEISVIIPIYREGPIIRDTIESILSQTFSDFEIILVDNNADSETVQLAEEYARNFPQRIRLTRETTQGIASAKNKGFHESHGEFIIFHDGDDISHPDRLTIQYEYLNKRPDLAFVGSWYDLVSFEKTLVKKNVSETFPTFWAETETIFNRYFEEIFRREKKIALKFPLISSCFFRRGAVIAAGNHDIRLNPRWFEENEFLLRIFEAGDGEMLPVSLISYRKHSLQGVKVMKDQMNWLGKTRHLNIFYQILKERYVNRAGADKALAELRSNFLRYTSHFLLQHPSANRLGRVALKRAMESAPGNTKTLKLLVKSFFPKRFYPRLFWFDNWMTEPLPKEVDERFIQTLFN